MQLTQQHFDQTMKGLATKDDIKGLVTKEDAKGLEKRVIARIDEAQEELALITKSGFDDVFDRLDVRERMQKLEKQMTEIRMALHLS